MKRNNLFSVLLLAFSIFFLVLSQPSVFFEDGLSFFAWLAYIPFFLLADRVSLHKSFLWGASYGVLAYALLCPWLSTFGAVALLFVCVIFAFYNALLFFFLSWSEKLFTGRLEKYFWIFRALLVLSVEFLRTHGVFAFSYGIIGYSQWKNPVFLKFSSLFGVFGVSLLILLFNSLVAKIISEKVSSLHLNSKRYDKRSILWNLVPFLSIFLGLVLFYFVSSFFPSSGKSESIRFALIQNYSSASSSSISDYEKDVSLLKKLTDAALASNPDTELVVWAETAVVPDVINNFSSTRDSRRHELAVDVFEYIKSKKCAFLIGSNHEDKDGVHNAALYFSPESNEVSFYHKNHLVPFTEFWPEFLDFKIFDPIKDSLNCEFFAHGRGLKTFSIKNLKFSAPICFEDSFSPLIRKMKKEGADFFVNISDDAWSSSDSARNMHLSMSAFRCAEYASPMIRSTIDGKTCALDSKGRVICYIDSEINGFLCGEIEVPLSGRTFYMLTGDAVFILICIFVFSLLLILSARFVKVSVYGRR